MKHIDPSKAEQFTSRVNDILSERGFDLSVDFVVLTEDEGKEACDILRRGGPRGFSGGERLALTEAIRAVAQGMVSEEEYDKSRSS